MLRTCSILYIFASIIAKMDRRLLVCIAVVVGLLVLSLAIAIPVALSKRQTGPLEMAKEWMSQTPLIDGYVQVHCFIKWYRVREKKIDEP